LAVNNQEIPFREIRMKTRILAAAALLLATPAALNPALAQRAPAQNKLYTSAAEVEALMAKAKAAGPKQATVENILTLANYRVNLEYRSLKGAASIHDTEAEMMYVIDGTGTITTGGTIPDVKRLNPANQTGTDITGGNTQAVSKGDFLIVPAGVPHLIVPTEGTVLTLMTFHVPQPPPTAAK
jgi:mannose-6-phosphate isomerase-like protein (cupin superfamily)